MFFPMKRWRGATSGGNRPGAAGSTAVVMSNGTLMSGLVRSQSGQSVDGICFILKVPAPVNCSIWSRRPCHAMNGNEWSAFRSAISCSVHVGHWLIGSGYLRTLDPYLEQKSQPVVSFVSAIGPLQSPQGPQPPYTSHSPLSLWHVLQQQSVPSKFAKTLIANG